LPGQRFDPGEKDGLSLRPGYFFTYVMGGRKMVTRTWALTIVTLVLSCFSRGALGIVVIDPSYQVEVYATYVDVGIGSLSNSIAFDPQGNLYLPHRSAGIIYKVDSAGTATLFAEGLYEPTCVQWVDNAAYGTYLYVTELTDAPSPGYVTRIDAGGNMETLSSVDWEPVSLAIDSVGNYGGGLYVGTNVEDKVITVAPDGTQNTFSEFPYNVPGGPVALAFDPANQYGGDMYVGTYSLSQANLSGLFRIDGAGNYTRFSSDLAMCSTIAFDPTQNFGGSMYAVAVDDLQSESTYWSDLWRVNPDGTTALFAHSDIYKINGIAFGPDDAMYVAEFNNGTSQTTISRISLIPEPATLLSLGLGTLALLRRPRRRQS